MSYFGILRLEFENTIVMFEINTLEYFYMQRFMQK